MRSHAKATSAGSISGSDSSRIRLSIAGLCLALALAFAGIGASTAAAAPMGLTGYFGNPDTTAGYAGGEFSSNPGGVAVNNATGDVYVADGGNNRIQRFDEDGNFISTWGADVISGAASGTGTWASGATSVTSVVATAGRFLVGQTVTGPGIEPGTQITAVGALGTSFNLTLSKATSAAGTGAALSVAAQPNNVAVNERQVLTVTATGGNFKLTLGAYQGYAAIAAAAAPNIPATATPGEIQTVLEGYPAIGAGNVAVSSSATGVYEIDFQGARADTNVVQLGVAAGSPALTGGTATIATALQGTAAELCTVASECKQGVSWGTGATEVNRGGVVNQPQGIAINQSTGDLYVSTSGFRRIEQFTANGAFVRAWGADAVLSGPEQADEQQRLTIDATAGQYKLTFGAQTTADIAFDASPATIQAQLEALSSIGAGNVNVSGGPGNAGGTTPYLIAFTGALADVNQAPITTSAGTTPLSGGAATAVIATLNDGAVGFEICNTATSCKIGVFEKAVGFNNSMGYPAVAPAGAPNAGNVLVGDGAARALEFTSTGSFVRSWGWSAVASGPGNTVANQFEVCRAGALDLCPTLAATGAGAGQFAPLSAGTPNRIAVSPSGDIYTLENTANFRVQKFVQSGESLTPSLFNPSIGDGETLSGTSTASTPTDLAIDPTDNHLYVARAMEAGKGDPAANGAERRIFEFDSTGTLAETHLANYALNSVNGFALVPGGEPGYLTSSTPKAGVHVASEPVPPTITVGATTAITATSATLNGSVNPNGGAPQETTYRFEYSSDGGSTWVKATPSDTNIGSGEAAVPVSQPIGGLEPNKDYVVRIVATKGGLPTNSPPGGAFKTATSAPGAQTLNAWWDGLTADLTLKAKVNPNNLATTYFFEYGPDDCSANPCTSVPLSEDASAGSGAKDVVVAKTISGLDTEASYHYRVVATSSAGTTTGADRTVGPGPTTEGSCSNQALRVENDSESLPECRAYELVSNSDSNGLGILWIDAIADDGERVMMTSQALGNPSSLPGQNNPYVAKRGTGGWEIIQHNPDAATGLTAAALGTTSYSRDLSTVLWAQSTAKEFATGEAQYLFTHEDGTEELAAPHMAPIERIGGARDGTFAFEGSGEDLSTFVFRVAIVNGGLTYLPGEPLIDPELSVFSVNLYQATDAGPSASLSLVNRDPSGTPISNVCGSQFGGLRSNVSSGNVDPFGYNVRPISADGSVVYFNARPGASTTGTCDRATFGLRIFKRIDDTSTVAVSESQCTRTVPTPCSSANGDDVFQGASADGESVFVSSTRQLTDSDEDSTNDLYLYDEDPPSGQPTLVQASAGEVTPGHPNIGSGAQVQGVLESSADGSRVYFVAKGQLTAEATAGANNLYVFQRDDEEPTGRIEFVGTLASGDSGLWGTSTKQVHTLPAYGPDGTGEGDGHLLLFNAETKLLPDDADSAADLYRYDDESGELLCISCQGDGDADVRVSGKPKAQPAAVQANRIATEDATSAVFVTEEALLSGDQNTVADVYLWREGVLSLISGGAGEAGSGVDASISPDGERIFFTTKAQLFPTDQNSGLDAYVANIDGGFKRPIVPVSKCEDGQTCRGSAPAPPPTSAPGSESFQGSGDVKAPKACKKGKVKRKGRCVKRKQRKAKRQASKKRANEKRANSNRGGNR